MEQGRRLLTKPVLLNGNYPGIDGIIVDRLKGNVTERVTVKAATAGGINTNVHGVIESLEKGRLSPHDTLFGIEGTKDRLTEQLQRRINSPDYTGNKEILRKALKHMRVKESGTNESVLGSMRRLYDKVENGQANPFVTMEQAGKMMGKGAIIGAASSFPLHLSKTSLLISKENSVRNRLLPKSVRTRQRALSAV